MDMSLHQDGNVETLAVPRWRRGNDENASLLGQWRGERGRADLRLSQGHASQKRNETSMFILLDLVDK